jgi:hypothetical protein
MILAVKKAVGSAVARQAGGRHEVALELPEHLARELEVLAKRRTLQLLFSCCNDQLASANSNVPSPASPTA